MTLETKPELESPGVEYEELLPMIGGPRCGELITVPRSKVGVRVTSPFQKGVEHIYKRLVRHSGMREVLLHAGGIVEG